MKKNKIFRIKEKRNGMYCIIYNNFEQKTIECLSSFPTFKRAYFNLDLLAIKYADDNKLLRPIVIWPYSEFDLNKIRQDVVNPNGHWMAQFRNKITLYRKSTFNSWFKSIDIQPLGEFQILEIPPTLDTLQSQCSTIDLNKSLSRTTAAPCFIQPPNLMDELQSCLKKRQVQGDKIAEMCELVVKSRKVLNSHQKFINELTLGRNKLLNAKI